MTGTEAVEIVMKNQCKNCTKFIQWQLNGYPGNLNWCQNNAIKKIAQEEHDLFHLKCSEFELNPHTPKDVGCEPLVEEEIKSNVPAIPLERHHLMKETNTDYTTKAQEEIGLNEELCLKNQTTINNAEIIRKDVEELTRSNNYYEVNEKIIRKLFQMGVLEWKCVWVNFKELISKIAPISIIWIIPTLVAILHGVIAESPIERLMMSTITIAVIANAVWWISIIQNTTYDWTNVILKKESVYDTKIKIPYGAKLKLKEAKDSQIFNDFEIIYPKVDVTERSYRMSVDPAIVGVCIDGRRYMVVYWDIEKDIEHSLKEIKRFKKFKLSKTS